MSGRAAAWLAWSGCAASIVAGVAGLALYHQSGHTPTQSADLGLSALDTAYSLALVAVGATIASRLPNNPVGWVLWAAGLLAAFGIGGLGHGYAVDSVEGPVGPLPGADWMPGSQSWA
jgi:hypothetical protein